MQGAVERIGAVPPGTSGALPTLELLIRRLEEEGRPEPEVHHADEDGRYRAAALLLRSLPLLHASSHPRRTAHILLSAIAGAFPEEIDSLLFFEVIQESNALGLEASFRRSDLDVGMATSEDYLDVEALEAAGAFDGSVYDRLREVLIPLDQDRDLLADAVYDGRTTVIARPGRELRLPTILVEHLPDGPAAVLPVFGRERVRGLLVLSAPPGIAGWTSDQMELVSAMASQAGLALESAGLLDLARRRGYGIRTLIEFASQALKPGTSEPWPDATLRALITATGGDLGVVWWRGSDQAFAVASSLGEPGAGERDLNEVGEGVSHWFDADARPILIEDVRSDPRLPGTLPEEWGAALAVPLRSAGALRGAVLVVRKSAGAGDPAEPFDAEDAQVAEMAASISTLAALKDGAEETTALATRRVQELEAQLKHADRLAVVGERGIMVAQEIRNPIAAITGFARRVLRSVGPSDPNREFLEIILRETERLERILTEQVSLAQMTRPRLKLQSLNALVQEVLETQSEELVKRRVRLLKRLSPDVPSLLIDNEKMRQVLANVLQYALHQVPSGGRVRVETRSGAGHVQAEVAHDGPKSPGESLDRLFVPFSATRRYGAGVGLAVAYQIVREHGGEIRARSEGDWSSIVTIYLPVRENQDRRGKPDRRGGGKSDRRRRLA
jgi:signal transduction histidine kinase